MKKVLVQYQKSLGAEFGEIIDKEAKIISVKDKDGDEISGDELNFQAISRTGKTVDSGVIKRETHPIRAAERRHNVAQSQLAKRARQF